MYNNVKVNSAKENVKMDNPGNRKPKLGQFGIVRIRQLCFWKGRKQIRNYEHGKSESEQIFKGKFSRANLKENRSER